VNTFNRLSDLESFRDRLISERRSDKIVLRTCISTGCKAQKSSKLVQTLKSEIDKQGLRDKIEIRKTGCHGFCEMGPIMVIEPENIFYCRVKPDDVTEIISSVVSGGHVIERLLWKDPATKEQIHYERELPLYRKQKKNVTYRSGRIDPTDIESYIAEKGYAALGKALSEITPSNVIQHIIDSGLRGRGGGGFLTGIKWKICSEASGNMKYIIANGDEGDPGAFMDRSLMEGDPHSIIEGMTIGAYAIGAEQGFIYVREEYPIAIEHLSRALEQAEEYGLLGNNILGTGLNFTIQIAKGAGAFVCGEETALITSIEGRSGTPRSRPPYPALSGLWRKPTIINNVETFANVPLIISIGAENYAGIGTETSKGTKVFSLVGKVMNTGLIEIEMGTALREIIFGIGGGIRKNKEFKAVQTGGPMGSGGMIVMDETSCMVDVARYFIDFLMFESCGKCTPCREGLKQMHQILTHICEGLGEERDIETLMELAQLMTASSLCGLGSTASNPVLSTIRHFRSEYESHIYERKCTAGVCRNLFEYVIDEELCNGCGLCRIKCPEKIVSGEKKKLHVIDSGKCIKCGICINSCKFDAVKVI
jgi:NADH-quinone oxidoreductase subunit F